MNRQDKFVSIAAVLGLISMFLPWQQSKFIGFYYSDNGFNVLGWTLGGALTLAFLASAAVALLSHRIWGEKVRVYIFLFCGVVATLIVVPKIIGFNDVIARYGYGKENLTYGIYLTGLAALGIPLSQLAVWFIKKP